MWIPEASFGADRMSFFAHLWAVLDLFPFLREKFIRFVGQGKREKRSLSNSFANLFSGTSRDVAMDFSFFPAYISPLGNNTRQEWTNCTDSYLYFHLPRFFAVFPGAFTGQSLPASATLSHIVAHNSIEPNSKLTNFHA